MPLDPDELAELDAALATLEARVEESVRLSALAVGAVLRQEFGARIDDLESRLDTVHRKALRAMTDALERRQSA